MSTKSSFLTFVLSWLPGLGHLYLGLNRRGLQFMIGFFICVAMIQVLPSVFPFAVAILWFYSLFDALQKVSVVNTYITRNGRSPAEAANHGDIDADVANLDETVKPLKALKGKGTDPLWIGIICVILGLLVLLRQVFPSVWYVLIQIHIGSILLAAILIGFGLWLIRKQQHKEEE